MVQQETPTLCMADRDNTEDPEFSHAATDACRQAMYLSPGTLQ